MSHNLAQHYELKEKGKQVNFYEGCSACRMSKAIKEIKESTPKELTPEDLKDIRSTNKYMKSINRFWR